MELRLILAALACFRITTLFVVDDGPWDIFLKFREWAGVYDLGSDDRPRSVGGRLLECPHCFGVWVAAWISVWVFGIVSNPGLDLFFIWLAIAGAQSILQKMAGR